MKILHKVSNIYFCLNTEAKVTICKQSILGIFTKETIILNVGNHRHTIHRNEPFLTYIGGDSLTHHSVYTENQTAQIFAMMQLWLKFSARKSDNIFVYIFATLVATSFAGPLKFSSCTCNCSSQNFKRSMQSIICQWDS